MNNDITIGMDLGGKYHIAVVFDSEGLLVDVAKVTHTKTCISKYLQSFRGSIVAIEACTHLPWIRRLHKEMDSQVYVGIPPKLRFIWDSTDKSDERDARLYRRYLIPSPN